MSVRLQIDDEHRVFTCLDYVTGSVVLHVNDQETISSITVKMEGISRSRLVIPRREGEAHAYDRRSRERKAELEVHKILYMAQTVFPAAGIRRETSSSSGYTLPHGTYEYPFKFRIPINNCCRRVDSLLQRVSIEKGQFDYARDPVNHTRTMLPPSLYGLPDDEASIRYFIKVTVNRPQFYKMNLRQDKAFVFLPIELPRPPKSEAETYGRKQHVFNILYPPSPSKRRGFFTKKNPPLSPSLPIIPPRFSIEARLPAPVILTPRESLGLRIILVKKEPFAQTVMLRQLQLRLFATTYITAHEQKKKVVSIMPIFNTCTAFPFGNESSPPEVELEADRGIWEGAMIPETVPPTFRTCNISRTYQLEVIFGVSYGMANSMDQIPIILPVQIFSGIRPPAELVRAATFSDAPQLPVSLLAPPSPTYPNTQFYPPSPHDQKPSGFGLFNAPGTSEGGSNHINPTSPASFHAQPSRLEIWNHDNLPHDAPPTYEDATIDDIAPVDGHGRRNRVYPQQDGYFTGISEVELTHSMGASPAAGHR